MTLMEITWFGHAYVRLRAREATVVVDPFDKSLGLTVPRVNADIILITSDRSGYNAVGAVGGNPKVIRGPGEYEIKNVFITGIQTPLDEKGKEKKQEEGFTTVYLIELEDLVICHLGPLGRVLSQTQVEAMGRVDVLLVPVGGGNMLKAAQAAEMVSLLEPRLVIPILYQVAGSSVPLEPLSRFTKEMSAVVDPKRNSLFPALRIEEGEEARPLEVTRSGAVANPPVPPIVWTIRVRR